jgi:hypothetical protein
MVIFAAVLKKVRLVDEHIGMEEGGNDVKWQKIKTEKGGMLLCHLLYRSGPFCVCFLIMIFHDAVELWP